MTTITIRKTWVTEEEIEVPNGLSREKLKEIAAGVARRVANKGHQWDGTIALNEDGDELLSF